MKTIEVSDKIYNELKELAHEIKTQDNRATANVFFQIRDKERIPAFDGAGDFSAFYNDDSGLELETLEEKKESIYEYLTESLEKSSKDAETQISEMSESDIDDFLKLAMNFEIFEYSYKHVYKCAFLTEKEAKRHLKANKHHYSEDAIVYGSSAWRNYDIQEIRSFLKEVKF